MKATATLATLMLVVGYGLMATASDSPPRLEVPQRTIDFGTVEQGEKLNADFTIVNSGGEPLDVTVRPTCGCTVVDFDRQILPGVSGHVRAVLDTKDFRGPITKAILVTSNDPDVASLRLLLKASVEPVFEVLPKPMVRLDTVQGSAVSATVVVAAVREGVDFTVTKVVSGVAYVTAAARRLEAAEPGTGGSTTRYEITVTVTQEAPLGFVNTPVIIHTDHVKAAAIRLKVVGTVRAAT